MGIYLGIGSNLGERRENLEIAVEHLKSIGIPVIQSSTVYVSNALLPKGCPEEWNIPFFNVVIEVQTDINPQALLGECQKIENLMGRKYEEVWAPRVIDIDILIYHSEIVETEALIIPHKQIKKRSFVLDPLAQIAPNLILPGMTETVLNLSRKHNRHQPQWMGILNLTPDSFSDGGKLSGKEELIKRCKDWISEGVDILDFGAESTRPGATTLSPKEEWERLEDPLSHFIETKKGVFAPRLSVDTYHSETIRKLLSLDIDYINDVSGLSDVSLLSDLNGHSCYYVIMHNLGLPASRTKVISKEEDVVDFFKFWCESKINTWESRGLKKERLIIDPGIGFGKLASQSIRLLQSIQEYQDYGVRILIGHSRKSFFNTITKEDFSVRDAETLGASLRLSSYGVDILRVHDPILHIRSFQGWNLVEGVGD